MDSVIDLVREDPTSVKAGKATTRIERLKGTHKMKRSVKLLHPKSEEFKNAIVEAIRIGRLNLKFVLYERFYGGHSKYKDKALSSDTTSFADDALIQDQLGPGLAKRIEEHIRAQSYQVTEMLKLSTSPLPIDKINQIVFARIQLSSELEQELMKKRVWPVVKQNGRAAKV